MDLAALNDAMQKFSEIASRPDAMTITVPERTYRLFRSLDLADKYADQARAEGANWRRVKRVRNKEFRRLMRERA